MEAVVLSSFGGLIGIALALGGSLWLSAVLNVPFVFNGGIVLVAFLFSALVGVIFNTEDYGLKGTGRAASAPIAPTK